MEEIGVSWRRQMLIGLCRHLESLSSAQVIELLAEAIVVVLPLPGEQSSRLGDLEPRLPRSFRNRHQKCLDRAACRLQLRAGRKLEHPLDVFSKSSEPRTILGVIERQGGVQQGKHRPRATTANHGTWAASWYRAALAAVFLRIECRSVGHE